MKLEIIIGDFSICKIDTLSDVNDKAAYYFLGKTDEELSLVCLTSDVPTCSQECDDGWRCFRIQGLLDFSLIGVLSKISTLLAEQNIGIFAVSTYNTDYILTKEADFQRSIDVLQAAGYQIEDKSL